MYLVLGEANEPFLEAFRSVIKPRGEMMLLFKEFSQDEHFSWRFDGTKSLWGLSIDGRRISVDEIRAVIVQKPPRLDPDHSPEPDAEYAQAESNAILFAWFSSLICPVINRYAAPYWFAPGVSLPLWEKLIRESGLNTAPAIMSNVGSELQQFARSLGTGASYAPFCDSEAYSVSGEQDWKGIVKMAAICPVNLTWFAPPRYVACVVGDRVFWNRAVSKSMTDCERQLVRMSKAAELEFIEVHFVANNHDLYVHWVESFPKLDAFDDQVRRSIVEALVDGLDASLGT